MRDRAEDLVSMADKIAQKFVTLDDITGGDIYLGLAESYQIRTLARAIREFRKQYPFLRYHILALPGNKKRIENGRIIHHFAEKKKQRGIKAVPRPDHPLIMFTSTQNEPSRQDPILPPGRRPASPLPFRRKTPDQVCHSR